MITRQMQFLSEVHKGEKIPLRVLSFFRARLQSRLWDLVVGEFQHKSATKGLTKADVARRLDCRPEQVTRWLATPGNWTTDTASDLMLAIGGAELGLSISRLADRRPHNYTGPDWLNAPRIKPATGGDAPTEKRPVANAMTNTKRPARVLEDA